MLSVMPEACQHFFNFFTRYYSQNSSQPRGRTSRRALRLRLPRRPPNVSCLPLFWDAARMPPTSANREANYLRCDESERHGSMVTMLLLFSRRRRKSRASRTVANFSRSPRRSAIPISSNSCDGWEESNQIRRAMRGRIAPSAERR
jgi:hypothetical protein